MIMYKCTKTVIMDVIPIVEFEEGKLYQPLYFPHLPDRAAKDESGDAHILPDYFFEAHFEEVEVFGEGEL